MKMKKINFDAIKNKIDKVMIQRFIIVILFIIILIVMLTGNKISTLEEESVISYSDIMINYIEDIEDVKDKEYDKYIINSLKYYYNEENKTEVGVKEVSEFIEKNYNIKISSKKMLELGISEKLMKENITFDSQKETYQYNLNKTLKDIANTKIASYKKINVKKNSKNIYQVTYQKYVIKNPYEVLNFYQDKDVTKIKNYITGKGTVKEFLESIEEKDLDKFATKKNEITVEYKVIDRKLTVSKVKES